MKYTLLVLFALLIIGCEANYKVKIESNTSWSGYMSGASVDGSGNRTIDIPEEDVVCATVQKETENGFVKVTLVDESPNIFGGGEIASRYTDAKYGIVTVCNK